MPGPPAACLLPSGPRPGCHGLPGQQRDRLWLALGTHGAWPVTCWKGQAWSQLFHLAVLKGERKKGLGLGFPFWGTFILSLQAVTLAGWERGRGPAFRLLRVEADLVHTGQDSAFSPWLCADAAPTGHTARSVPAGRPPSVLGLWRNPRATRGLCSFTGGFERRRRDPATLHMGGRTESGGPGTALWSGRSTSGRREGYQPSGRWVNERIPVPSVPRAMSHVPWTLRTTFPSASESAWIPCTLVFGERALAQLALTACIGEGPQFRTWSSVLGRTPCECRLCGTAGVSPNQHVCSSAFRPELCPLTPRAWDGGWGLPRDPRWWLRLGPRSQGAALPPAVQPIWEGHIWWWWGDSRPHLGTLGAAESSGHAGYSWPL